LPPRTRHAVSRCGSRRAPAPKYRWAMQRASRCCISRSVAFSSPRVPESTLVSTGGRGPASPRGTSGGRGSPDTTNRRNQVGGVGGGRRRRGQVRRRPRAPKKRPAATPHTAPPTATRRVVNRRPRRCPTPHPQGSFGRSRPPVLRRLLLRVQLRPPPLRDRLAWCWAKGGDWRRRIEPVVTDVRRL